MVNYIKCLNIMKSARHKSKMMYLNCSFCWINIEIFTLQTETGSSSPHFRSRNKTRNLALTYLINPLSEYSLNKLIVLKVVHIQQYLRRQDSHYQLVNTVVFSVVASASFVKSLLSKCIQSHAEQHIVTLCLNMI